MKKILSFLLSLLLFTTISSADEIGGGNIHSNFPPLGFSTATIDIVRPRSVQVSSLINNGNGSITLPFLISSDLSSYWKSDGSSTATGNWNIGANNFTLTGSVGIGSGIILPACPLDVRGTGIVGGSIDIINAGTAVTNIGGLTLSASNPTTNNYVGVLFADNISAYSGASGHIGMQMTDRINHYGELSFGLRSASGYLEGMRLSATELNLFGNNITTSGTLGAGATTITTLTHTGRICNYNAQSADYPVVVTDDTVVLTGAVNKTFTLPTAVGATRVYTFKNNSTAILTIATTSSQTIDGSTTYLIRTTGSGITVQSDNANWQIIGVF